MSIWGATLLELIAPKGFEYYSLGKSLTRGANVGFNDGVWLTPEAMGRIDGTEPQQVKRSNRDVPYNIVAAHHTGQHYRYR